MVMNYLIWDNVVHPSFFSSLDELTTFTDSLIELLRSNIRSGTILGSFYTFYNIDTTSHVKIGLQVNEGYDTTNLKRDISDLMGDHLLDQEINTNIINSPSNMQAITDKIACWSFELLPFTRNRSNEEIAQLYCDIFKQFKSFMNIGDEEAIGTFQAFRVNYPRYFLSQHTITILNNNTSQIDSHILIFCNDIASWLRDNVSNYRDIWFLCDRLFHHCNNSNNKFGRDEGEIFYFLLRNIC